MNAKWRTSVVGAICVVALTGAGCGSSSSSSSSVKSTTAPGASVGGGSAAVMAAKADVAKWSVNPSITVSAPLAKRPPTGKTFLFLQCSVPVCAQIGDGMQAASQALGWTFKRETFDLAKPESLISLLKNAAAAPPSFLALTTFPAALYTAELAKLKSEHVPVIVGSDAVDEPKGATNDIYGNIASNPSEANAGARKAQWIIANSNGTGKVVHFAASDIATVTAETDALKQGLAACSGCHLDVVDIPTAALAGGKVPSTVVSYLQAHPDTQYISFSFGDMTSGVDQALAAAGLSKKVKFVGVTPTLANLQALKSGTEQGAWLGWPAAVQGWQFVDVAARIASGSDPSVAATPLLPVQWLTQSTAPTQLYEPTGYQSAYKKLWKVP